MASDTVISYAEMLLAIVPAAAPTRKNQRATSWPAPISANVPYLVLSRLISRAFWCVSRRFECMAMAVPERESNGALSHWCCRAVACACQTIVGLGESERTDENPVSYTQ